MNLLTSTLIRDLRLGLRRKNQLIMAPVFFMMLVILFPLALGPDPVVMKLAAPGLLVVAALLAALLPLDTLFRDDDGDGSLDLLLTSGEPLCLYVFGKIVAYWLLTSLPLLAAAPVMMLALDMPLSMAASVLSTLFPVTWLLNLFGAAGAALALGTRPGSVLLALLLIPFYIPVLIFGAAALDLTRNGVDAAAPLLLLWALLALALPVVPLVTAAILKGLRE